MRFHVNIFSGSFIPCPNLVRPPTIIEKARYSLAGMKVQPHIIIIIIIGPHLDSLQTGAAEAAAGSVHLRHTGGASVQARPAASNLLKFIYCVPLQGDISLQANLNFLNYILQN